MTKDTDLLPCPFCGSNDLWIAPSRDVNRLETRPDRKAVQCQGCSAFAPIRLWNTRSRPSGGRTIEIVFDGPPGPVPGRFIEVESPAGTSIRFGEWVERDNGWWALRFTSALGVEDGE